MPPRCAVKNCHMKYEVSKVMGLNISFFSIPKKEHLRQQWLANCNVNTNANTARVCSLHFLQNDFERDLKAELLNLTPKLLLKRTAIPSVNLENIPQEKIKSIDECNDSLLSVSSIQTVPKLHLDQPESEAQQSVACQTEIYTDSEHLMTIDILKSKIYQLTMENQQLKSLLTNKRMLAKAYRCKITSLTRRLEKTNNGEIKKEINSVIKDKLSGVFTTKQFDKILTKRHVKWGEEDIGIAFTLRYLSKRCYLYLRNHLNYPLPGISTLHRWSSKIDMRHGILESMLLLLSVAAKNFSVQEKLAVLSFDEMKVAEIYEYDQKYDQIIGPHSQMQVVIARGLFASWKQPIFADFDTKITKSLLETLIIKMFNVGFEIVGCVSDCGASNVGLWKELNITYQSPHILHPCTSKNIYFFADAPHLLKLVRNWLLDSEFNIHESTINKQYLEKIIKECNTEVSSCYKINEEHLKCEGPKRQNVKLAAELLSRTVGIAIRRYYSKDKAAIALSEFIILANDWFDIMNSHIPNNTIPWKTAFGKELDIQNNILDNMYNLMIDLRCKNKRTLQIFQKGILMSINSLKGLYNDMKKEYNIEYILTHRLNQDVLENLFSQIRTRGGLNDHPTPLSALQKMRVIVLGNPVSLSQKTNTQEQGKREDFIVGKVFQIAEISEANVSTSTSSLSDRSICLEDNVVPNQEYATIQSEEDGLQYLAGWIAKTLKSSYSKLEDCTHKQNNNHNYSFPSWVQQLSIGGLTLPTDNLKQLVLKLETEFQMCLGDGIDHSKKIRKKIFKKMSPKFEQKDHDIIKKFIRQRIFIRISYLNNKYHTLKKSKIFKRKIHDIRKQVNKKLKKFTQ